MIVFMQLIFLLLLTAVCAAVFVISVIFIYLTVSSGFMKSSPSVPTYGKVKDAMIKEAADILETKDNLIVMDLGSGWGTLLLPLAQRFPNHKFVGIELGRLPYLISVWRARKLDNLSFLRQNFFESDISSCDIMFVFLLNSTMTKLSSKIKNEMKPQSLVIANRFPIQNAKPFKKVSKGSDYYSYYVYLNE